MALARSATLDLRVTTEQKELIRLAAAASGKTITDFILGVVEPTARAMVEQQQVIEVSQAAWSSFTEMVEANSKATPLAKQEAREFVAEFGRPSLPG